MSTDVEKSKRFYSELLNWKIKKDEHSPYELILVGERDIGGILPQEQPGVPSHWVGYVSVDSIDQALTQVQRLGGKVLKPKAEIPGVGQFAVVSDPQGAVFLPFQYGGETPKPETDEMPPPGQFCWDELYTPDPDAAEKFYAPIFRWTGDKMDMGAMGTYTVFKREQKDGQGMARNAGGMMKQPPAVPRPFWLPYIAVANTDETVARAQKLGATPTMAAMDIPNVGRFAVLLDPTQAAIAVLSPPAK
jgi:predicted enzyme related to lactoylglutathione lyase